MAQHTLSHFYPTYAVATQVMADLAAMGVPVTSMDLIESETDARLPAGVVADAAQSPARTGATLGGGIGLGLGALIGVGAIQLPLLDPLAAQGWILPTLIGAVVGAALGGLVGNVTRMGVADRQSHSFAEGLQRGEHLLQVRIGDQMLDRVEAVMARARADSAASAPIEESAV